MGIIIKSLLFIGMFSFFCTTKVSEWVLLNNIPENYLLVFNSNQNTGSDMKAANKVMVSKISSANLQYMEIAGGNTIESDYTLYRGKKLVGKYSTIAELNGLTTSPLREQIAKEIMQGKLCVMLLLTCGNEAKDSKSFQTIRKTLEASPFKSVITYVELNRKSTEEAHFVDMLLQVEDDLRSINEPMLFGIYGRFRALEPLVAGGISGENIGYMISFFTADCSCLIKDELPGVDMLFTNNWENPVPALVNKILDENPSLQHR